MRSWSPVSSRSPTVRDDRSFDRSEQQSFDALTHFESLLIPSLIHEDNTLTVFHFSHRATDVQFLQAYQSWIDLLYRVGVTIWRKLFTDLLLTKYAAQRRQQGLKVSQRVSSNQSVEHRIHYRVNSIDCITISVSAVDAEISSSKNQSQYVIDEVWMEPHFLGRRSTDTATHTAWCAQQHWVWGTETSEGCLRTAIDPQKQTSYVSSDWHSWFMQSVYRIITLTLWIVTPRRITAESVTGHERMKKSLLLNVGPAQPCTCRTMCAILAVSLARWTYSRAKLTIELSTVRSISISKRRCQKTLVS